MESLYISDWAKDFEQLGLNGVSYQLFSEFEFKEAIGNRLVLVKPKNFSSPTSALLEEFSDKCREHFKVRPEVVIEEGYVTNSPSLLKEKIANQNLEIKELPIKYLSRSKEMGKKISFVDAFYAIRAILTYKYFN